MDVGSQQFIPQYQPQEALLQDYYRDNPLPESPPTLPSPPWPQSPTPIMAWKAQDLKENHIIQLSEPQCREITSACNTYSGELVCFPPNSPKTKRKK